MSKTLLNTHNVPKYIRQIVQNLYPIVDYDENDIPGYSFKLFGQHSIGYESQLTTDCKKLLAWCQRYYAEAQIVSEHFWWTEVVPPIGSCRCDLTHRRKAYRDGFRNYIKVVITDPVAHRFEKDKFYRG